MFVRPDVRGSVVLLCPGDLYTALLSCTLGALCVAWRSLCDRGLLCPLPVTQPVAHADEGAVLNLSPQTLLELERSSLHILSGIGVHRALV